MLHVIWCSNPGIKTIEIFAFQSRKEEHMKIKQSTFYALQAMWAIYEEDNVIVTSRIIAKKTNLSQGVVIKVLSILEKAGILRVYQGRGEISGGFSLNKSIDEVTFLEIVETMEGVDICANLSNDESKLLDKVSQINDQLRIELSRYTVRELLEA